MGLKPRRGSSTTFRAARRDLLDFALSLPEAALDHPWGEDVAKVRGKVFVFFGHATPDELGLSVKLPDSGLGLLEMPFATPTGYGLGKSGWVSVRSTREHPLPAEMLRELVLESYRAVAPKKLAAELG